MDGDHCFGIYHPTHVTKYRAVIIDSFRFGACPPVLIILFRLCLPETKSYIERDAVRHANGNLTSTFISEGRVAVKRHWLLLLYLVLLMAGFNFMVSLKY